MGIIQQLRERRLVQILVSYAATGWIILEVLNSLIERGVVPEMLYEVALIWFVVGLPATLLIGWHHGIKGKQKAPVSELALLSVLALTAVGFSGSTVNRHLTEARIDEAREAPLDMRKLAVLYFEDYGDGSNQFLADGLTEDLIQELSRVNGLSVISRNGSAQFRDTELSEDSVARALGVGTLIRGGVEERGDRIRVQLQLLEGESGAVFKRVNFERPREDFLAMRQAVVEEAAELLREYLREEVRVRESQEGTNSTAAWALLQRAEKTRKDAEARVAQGDMAGAWGLFDQADGLLADAQQVDREWSTPLERRAHIAYRRARLSQASPADAVELIEQGVAFADEALDRRRTDARALSIRGTLKYYHWLLNVTPDADARARLLADATTDLESAVQFDRTLADAHATLSHLRYQDNLTSAVIAAREALAADAYLEVADLVLWRLFNGSLDIENFQYARQACADGQRRFPEDYRFVTCELRLLTTPAIEPRQIDVDAAWRLLARQDSLTPEARRPFERARSTLIVGGAIARTGAVDSARAVLDRTRNSITPQVDPTQELVLVEAYMRILSGEKDRAIDLLQQIAAANPEAFQRNRGEVAWWWRDLASDPRFRRLAGLD